jgi:ABC-type transport system involved in multi-copper enzyme maturation permease subunit
MRRFAADVWWVAVYELGEAVRTRLFQLVLLLYVGGIAGSTWFFVKLLQGAEESAASTLGVPGTERPGAMMGTFLQNAELIAFVGRFAGPAANVSELLKEPLLGLFIGMVSMALLPAVLTFSASGSIAAEVKSRSIRYLLCRTGRLQIGLGKLAGQLLIALVATALGGAVCWGMGMTLMIGNPPTDLALSLLERSARASIWALPFAGLGLAASQWIPSPNGARVVAGSVIFAMPLAAFWLHLKSGTDLLGRLADLAGMFIATTAWTDFWSTDPSVFAAAAVRSVVLAVVYYSLGHVIFARRNL